MGPFVMAWMVGETIIIYRSVKTYKAPPGPGQLLLSSGLFGLLSLIAESDKGRRPATLMAWGLVLASFMNLSNLPTNISRALGQVKAADKSQKWPPSIADNTVVIPNGSSTTSSSTSSSSGSGSTSKTPSYTPNLTE